MDQNQVQMIAEIVMQVMRRSQKKIQILDLDICLFILLLQNRSMREKPVRTSKIKVIGVNVESLHNKHNHTTVKDLPKFKMI